MNPFLVGVAIAWMAFGIYKAAQTAITFYALLVKAQEELK